MLFDPAGKAMDQERGETLIPQNRTSSDHAAMVIMEVVVSSLTHHRNQWTLHLNCTRYIVQAYFKFFSLSLLITCLNFKKLESGAE